MDSTKKISQEVNENIYRVEDGTIIIELSSHDFGAILDEDSGFLMLKLYNKDSKLYKAIDGIK